MIRIFLILVAIGFAAGANAQSTSLDDVPIAWGEADERHTTVCAKRWHAVRIRDLRTASVNRGEGVTEQVKAESRAVLRGEADCFTGQVIYRPVAHADVILGARTWVQVIERDGPVPCFEGKRCRWTVQVQNFVESDVVFQNKELGVPVYVATPRPVQPARVGGPPPKPLGN